MSIGIGAILILVLALMLPVLNEFISTFLATETNPYVIFLISLAPLSILVGIINRVFRGNDYNG